MDIKKKFGIRLRELRKEQGLSQQAFADKAGFHRTYISDVERGVKNVSLENVERIAIALDVPLFDIFNF